MVQSQVLKIEQLDRVALFMASFMAGVSSGAAWLALLMRPYAAEGALGVICTHARTAALHCPACYAAAALIAAGVVCGLAALWPAADRRA